MTFLFYFIQNLSHILLLTEAFILFYFFDMGPHVAQDDLKFNMQQKLASG